VADFELVGQGRTGGAGGCRAHAGRMMRTSGVIRSCAAAERGNYLVPPWTSLVRRNLG
jgi:hypothetical protein